MKIKALRARSLRGIPRSWPDLPVGDRGLIVYGPNGVGKSSIIDGFEFGLTLRSTLFQENRLGVSWETAAPHVKDGAAEVVIAMTDGAAEVEIGPAIANPALSADGRRWTEIAGAANFVLRRHMLLRFINEQPRERYELLAPFCNLGAFQLVEIALKALADRLETQRALKNSAGAASDQRLRQLFKMDQRQSLTEASLLEQVNNKLQAAGLAKCAEPSQLVQRRTELRDALGGKDVGDRLAGLGGLKSQAQRLGRVVDLKDALSALQAALSEQEQVHAGRVQDVLVDLLVEGKRAIEAVGLDTCPLCEQDIDRTAVLARIDERIRSDEQITRVRKTAFERRKGLGQPLADLRTALKTFMESWASLGLDPLTAAYPSDAQLVSDLIAAIENDALTSGQLQDLIVRTQASVPGHDAVIAALDGLIAKEGGGEQRNLRIDASGMIDAFGHDWLAHQTLVTELRKIEARKRIIDRIHGHSVEARKFAVQKTLDTVSETANRFYDVLHPGENIATSRLAVRQTGQGSVTLSTSFYGREEPPLLHYSESHLDTLGLCYFLALRKHEAERDGHFKVLILDDVMHSVDAEHRARVARLLCQEFSDHQIILATHDTHFYDALRKTLGSGGFSYQAITGWDIDRGPILSDPSTDLDVILDKANYPGRRTDDLSATGGRFFEWLLKQLNERLQVAVQARFERRHDVGSLWPPLCSKLKRQRGFVAAYPSLAEGLDSSAWVRNACGAHDNQTASAVAPDEVRDFAGHLADLYNAAYCDNCGTFIAKQLDDGWRCDCANLSFAARD